MSEKHVQRVVELGAIGEWLLQKIEVFKTERAHPSSTAQMLILAQLEQWHEEVTEDIVMLVQENQQDMDGNWREVKR